MFRAFRWSMRASPLGIHGRWGCSIVTSIQLVVVIEYLPQVYSETSSEDSWEAKMADLIWFAAIITAILPGMTFRQIAEVLDAGEMSKADVLLSIPFVIYISSSTGWPFWVNRLANWFSILDCNLGILQIVNWLDKSTLWWCQHCARTGWWDQSTERNWGTITGWKLLTLISSPIFFVFSVRFPKRSSGAKALIPL